MSESSLIYCFGHSNNFLYVFIPFLASSDEDEDEHEDMGVGMMRGECAFCRHQPSRRSNYTNLFQYISSDNFWDNYFGK